MAVTGLGHRDGQPTIAADGAPRPARLYAALAGAALFTIGILGFFEDLSWLNFLHLASGALGLLLAGSAARPYALCLGAVYLGLAVFDFDSAGWLHLTVGLLGLAAALGTSEARPQPAAKRS